jgi:hypothetical protein|tara:strand:- start:154 stop:354 length:201 start_codon:yes stop_codon:yes gene_type:complete
MSERGLVMCVHSITVALAAYGIMYYLLKQSPIVAENRSVLIGAFVLFYMVSFGHDIPPNGLNPQLF